MTFKNLYNLLINHVEQCETLFPAFSDQALLKKVLNITYSPFYHKTTYNYSSILSSSSLAGSYYRLLSLLRSIESNTDNIMTILTQSSSPELEMYESILSGGFKNLPVQLVNKIFPNLVPIPIKFNEPILRSFLPKDVIFPIVLEPYIKGFKVNVKIINGTMIAYTSDFKDVTSKLIKNLNDFPKELTTFNCTIVPNELIRSIASLPLISGYTIYISDTDCEGSFLERKRKLSSVLKKDSIIKLSPFIEVDTYENLLIYYNNFISNGFTDLLLINSDSSFKNNIPYLISSLFTNEGIILHKVGMEEKSIVVGVAGNELLITNFSERAKSFLYSNKNIVGFKCKLEYNEKNIICTQIFSDAT